MFFVYQFMTYIIMKIHVYQNIKTKIKIICGITVMYKKANYHPSSNKIKSCSFNYCLRLIFPSPYLSTNVVRISSWQKIYTNIYKPEMSHDNVARLSIASCNLLIWVLCMCNQYIDMLKRVGYMFNTCKNLEINKKFKFDPHHTNISPLKNTHAKY